MVKVSMQDIILKKLGLGTEGNFLVKYWRIKLFTEYQGLTVTTLLRLLNKHKDISWIPARKYGLEFEGGLPVSKEEFGEILQQEGIPFRICGYDHQIEARWKLGSDSSVSITDLLGVEITSPQLIGMGNSGLGFVEVVRLLEIWNRLLMERGFEKGVNRTCGGHVHVDTWDFNFQDLFRLALLVYLSWDFLQYIIPPSRRDNQYCMKLNYEFFVSLLRGENLSRYYCINTTNFGHGHIEFRFWPGTLNVQKVRMHLLISLLLTEVIKKEGIKKFYSEEEVSFEKWLDLIGLRGPHPIMEEVRVFTEERFHHFLSRENVEPFTINFSEKVLNLFRELLVYSLRDFFRRSNIADRIASSVVFQNGELQFKAFRKRWKAVRDQDERIEILLLSSSRTNSESEEELVSKAYTLARKIFDLIDLFQLEEFNGSTETETETENEEEAEREEMEMTRVEIPESLRMTLQMEERQLDEYLERLFEGT